MTTMELPPQQASRRPTPAGTRFVDVRANLMPPEVLSARQVDVVRRRVLVSLVALVGALALGLGFSWWQTHSAESDLTGLQRGIAASQVEQGKYAKLAQAQADVASAREQLSTVMVGDLSWHDLTAALRSAAPSGAKLTSINGSVTGTNVAQAGTSAASGASTTTDPLATGSAPAVGTLTLAGAAHDQQGVARYADRIAKIKGITSVFVTGVAGAAGTGGKSTGVTFTVTASMTGDLLGGRFTTSTGTASTAGTAASTGGN